jgi:uncharacterized membrane protein
VTTEDAQPGGGRRFRARGADISRLEGFSDCVFGFAVTLLVVSLAVPTSFDDLVSVLRTAPSFAISFALLTWIWWSQYRFFRRYGVEDQLTVLLTLVLLFFVLIYIYPLKVLYAAIFGSASVSYAQLPLLFVIYGLGFTAALTTITLLYVNAYRQRDALELNEMELMLTRLSILEFAAVSGVGLISAGLALLPLPGGSGAWAGWSYFLIPAVYTATGIRRRRALRRLSAQSA